MNTQWLELTNKVSEDMYVAFKKLAETNTRIMQEVVEKQTQMMTTCIESAQENAEKLSSVKDYKEAMTLQGEIMRTCGDKVVGNYKEVVGLLNAAQADLNSLVEENLKTAEENIEKATKTAKKAA